ncbi:MAG: aminopeptidase [Melioribacteraceae bacterium]|nr:aminopeptidase [Melioribacteraceae bacterium]MCF8356860.1 aminopeptidase [Melioribacteraceae bacterium]MCF8396239.1 aminopeptidase [Melioribacteraceae bacterium]MCF8421155.1 aminopeptidase [Melioribacteraceae bacterium]
MKLIKYFLTFSFLLTANIISQDDDEKNEDKDKQQFEMIYEIPTTPVKSQDRSGTCWSFATTSFVETELLHMGKGEHDLSEMYFVYFPYLEMAEKYMRYHGSFNFGPGGQAHDVMNVIREFGFVPETSYTGKIVDPEIHNHSEMHSVLNSMLDAAMKRRGGKLSPVWDDAFKAVLDIYLGKLPEKINYDGNEYTPKEFSDALGFNPDDYIEFTSYESYPFFEKVNLEIPDNWSHDLYYNLPIDELISVMNYALENGYSVDWDGDVSEKEFSMDEGYAIVPAEKDEDENDEEDMEEEELDEEENEGPEKEKEITQEMRQETFDNFSTTDDHLMHITGLAENQNGSKFYLTKNSWGEKGKYDGFIYMSEPFVRLKTVAIMVHKNAVPDGVKNKLK